jgi:hypothetical protein
MYYSDYCKTDVNFLFLIFAVVGNLKCVNNGKNIEAIHDDANRTMMAARWLRDGLRATSFMWLQDTSYTLIDHRLCSAFAERYHEEISSFHLPIGGIDTR